MQLTLGLEAFRPTESKNGGFATPIRSHILAVQAYTDQDLCMLILGLRVQEAGECNDTY